MVTGLPLGVLLWRLETTRKILQPYLTTYYAIPIFAFYPLFIAIFGLGAWPVIIIAWAWAVVAIVLNTVIGLDKVPEVLVKVGRSLRLSRWRMFTRIYFPAATPYIFTGLKLAASYTVIGVIASEFIQAETGVGWFVGFSYNNFAIQNMYAAILLILVFAVALNSGLLALERRLYGRQADGDGRSARPAAPGARRGPARPARAAAALLALWQIVGMPAGDFYIATPVQALDAVRRRLVLGQPRRDAARRRWSGSRSPRCSGSGSASRSGSSRFWGKVFEPITLSVYSIPKVTLFPIFLTVFGFGLYSKVAFGMFHGIFPIIIIAMNATREVSVVHLKVARSLRLSRAARRSGR